MMCATPDCGRPHGRGGLAAEPGPQEYEAAFRDNKINERVLPSLTAEDLKELGVTALGHCRILLDAIVALRADAGGKAPSADVAPSAPGVSPEEAAAPRAPAATQTLPTRHSQPPARLSVAPKGLRSAARRSPLFTDPSRRAAAALRLTAGTPKRMKASTKFGVTINDVGGSTASASSTATVTETDV